MNTALKCAQAAVDLTPDDHPDPPSRLQGLAVSYTDMYNRTGLMEHLEAALINDHAAVDVTPIDNPLLSRRQHNLAVSLRDKCNKTKNNGTWRLA
jgi:hypothetical protein